MPARTPSVRLLFGLSADGLIQVQLDRIAPWVYRFALKTTAPGWGGLYGGQPGAGVWYANSYQATIAALRAASDYWRGKGHIALAQEIDELIDNYCFDDCLERVHDATDQYQL